MRMLVLGAGQQGSACAYDLLTETDYEVVLADHRVEQLPEFLEPFAERLEVLRLDAEDAVAVRAAMEGANAVMSAFPYYLNLEMSRAALEAGAHFCDLGGNTDIVLQQKELQERALEKRVSIIPDCGLAPGMVNVLAEHGIRQLDRAVSVRIKVGGLPRESGAAAELSGGVQPRGRAGLLHDALLDSAGRPGTAGARPHRDRGAGLPRGGSPGGLPHRRRLSTMAQRYEGRLDSMEYKTLRYPGHAQAMRLIRDLGLLELGPVWTWAARQIVPREAFMAVVGPRLERTRHRSPDLVALGGGGAEE